MADGLNDPALAAAQYYRRRRARESLVQFAQEIPIPGKAVTDADTEGCFNPIETSIAAHHGLMMEVMQETMATPNGRAMFFLPPGSAKSTYGSVVAPTWYIGKHPGSQIILASYGDDLAKKIGRKARQIVRSDRYRQIFATSLTKDSSAADQWALENGSEYMAGGILSGLTGNRADGLIIDDPTKGRREAESPTNQETIWQAYQDDARTRLKPGGWRFIIMTRWDEQDLAGRILPEKWAGESGPIACRDGHIWNVVCLPAIADRTDDPLGRPLGAPLWPEWFPVEHWREFQQNPRSWLSLFQQKPTAESGTYFQRDWFRRYSHLPDHLNYYMTGDFATQADAGDFTEIGVWGICPAGNLYAVDWWYGQTTTDVWIERLLDRVDKYDPQWFIGEGGPIRRAIEPWLHKRMGERNAFVACDWLPTTHDKPTMARSFQALASVGRVHLPNVDWAERLLDQLMRFPNGANDDAVDTCSLFGRFVDRLWSKTVPKPEPVPDFAAPLRIQDLAIGMPKGMRI